MKPVHDLPASPTVRFLEWGFPDPTDWSIENIRPLRAAVEKQITDALLNR
jgi:arsenate reductase